MIVADSGPGARRLYERQGYAETARRPMAKNGRQSRGSEWVLLLREI